MQIDPINLSVYSDLYKSVYGIRPNLASAPKTEEDMDREFEYLQTLLDEILLEEKEYAESCIEKFKKDIQKIAGNFGLTFAEAIRWDMQAEGYKNSDFRNPYEVEHYYWKAGIPHAKAQEFARIYHNINI